MRPREPGRKPIHRVAYPCDLGWNSSLTCAKGKVVESERGYSTRWWNKRQSRVEQSERVGVVQRACDRHPEGRTTEGQVAPLCDDQLHQPVCLCPDQEPSEQRAQRTPSFYR